MARDCGTTQPHPAEKRHAQRDARAVASFDVTTSLSQEFMTLRRCAP